MSKVDDLRARISDALIGWSGQLSDADRYEMADVLVCELGLRQESRVFDGAQRRFVTDWEPDSGACPCGEHS